MPSIQLQQVKNFNKLLEYLESELGWPVNGREIDDITFPFDLENDLGLDKKEVAKVRHVYRLKKMHKKQPFGIFFVDFEGKKMPVAVLKRILRSLALRRRANARSADQLAWDVEDLIFISAVGEEKDSSREISFAHFRKEPDGRHVLRVLAWDGGDTPLKMEHVDEVLHQCLRFPDDLSDIEAWRKSWTAAFRASLGQNIRRSEELAQALAKLAMRINKEALSLIKKESPNGPLRTLHAGFKDALIHDLTEEAFTDCYAQTITYGLLTAAITKVNQDGVKDLTSTSVLDLVPSTNPFLKDILSSFLEAGGRGEKGIDFDDLGVQDVIDLLRSESTDLPNILRDFGNLTQDEDPVIHFYETFLKIYNKEERVKRGAFYTPRPVVSYIVRSVDELLRKEFGLEDGLADTTTWGEIIKRNPAIKLPPLTDSPNEKKTISESEPFVQILDPATGTATFLVEVINIIEKTVKAKAWSKLKKGAYNHDQHSKREEVLKAWNEYVPEHLLKRLHAYELMMAPYVIAHMKVGLKLAETGYRFATEERARIYLTNGLEHAKDFKERLNFDIPALAIEANQVNQVKRNKRFTVIIGNPPYSHSSANLDPSHRELVEPYKFVRGERIRERGALQFELNIQDDYVKFIRLSEMAIDLSGIGVVGLITNNAYLDSTTFRGLRAHLLDSYDLLQIIDLHGSVKAISSLEDENVFDIQQGVAIQILGRHGKLRPGKVKLDEVIGSREMKYSYLKRLQSFDLKEDITPRPPGFLFIRRDESQVSEYESGLPIDKIFNLSSSGVKTNRDGLTIAHTPIELMKRIEVFTDTKIPSATVAEKLNIEDKKYWNIDDARKSITKGSLEKSIRAIEYRPFDQRQIVYHDALVFSPRKPVMVHLSRPDNMALLLCRQQIVKGFFHAFVTRGMFDCCLVSNRSRENTSGFPLYTTIANDQNDLLSVTRNSLNSNISGDATIAFEKIAPGAEPSAIFNYTYALLYSPEYRKRYDSFLQRDFPRIPIPSSIKLFNKLAHIANELITLHLFESPKLNRYITQYVGRLDNEVKNISWSNNTVWLNKERSSGFNGVSEQVWNFNIGSYQVCEKWLKDRKGRKLFKEDIEHYSKIIVSISETIRLMAEIDKVIDENGGWPKAFQ